MAYKNIEIRRPFARRTVALDGIVGERLPRFSVRPSRMQIPRENTPVRPSFGRSPYFGFALGGGAAELEPEAEADAAGFSGGASVGRHFTRCDWSGYQTD